jgi:hypothetical protein
MGHVVQFGASGAQNNDTLFFILRWDYTHSTKGASGHVMPNLCFYIRWDLRVT